MKVGRDFLKGWATLVTPKTPLRSHRLRVARKANQVRKLLVKMADENPEWRYGASLPDWGGRCAMDAWYCPALKKGRLRVLLRGLVMWACQVVGAGSARTLLRSL